MLGESVNNMRHLEQSFKSMVIDILVHIESREDVECLTEVNLPRNNRITFEDWEKVCRTNYRVHIDNGHDPITVAIEIGLDNPHAVVGVGIVEGLTEVVDEGTGEDFTLNLERKKQMDPGDVQAPHPRCVGSSVEDDAVTSRCDNVTGLPSWSTPDGFPVQAAGTGRIARCAEGGGC